CPLAQCILNQVTPSSKSYAHRLRADSAFLDISQQDRDIERELLPSKSRSLDLFEANLGAGQRRFRCVQFRTTSAEQYECFRTSDVFQKDIVDERHAGVVFG